MQVKCIIFTFVDNLKQQQKSHSIVCDSVTNYNPGLKKNMAGSL
jgi:hypothetical protein